MIFGKELSANVIGCSQERIIFRLVDLAMIEVLFVLAPNTHALPAELVSALETCHVVTATVLFNDGSAVRASLTVFTEESLLHDVVTSSCCPSLFFTAGGWRVRILVTFSAELVLAVRTLQNITKRRRENVDWHRTRWIRTVC